ncbi:TonB-dependent receptor [Paludibaculum fermentans]|uniref:TonB-dependent receptor n=1 Tax=Paludibaculum fermentans TaxID=1473598 RepID=A0A7S7NX60_PALFE|nr:carboxypeptidase regulatory-like domain-containing protein [Paludibaculum fermentans]QOY91392.1 TonB-dependent receptor [Paludibaculum fermentans]
MRFRCIAPTAAVCALVLVSSAVQAQSSAALSGQIVDPSKANIVGAKVTLTDLQHGSQRTTTSNDSGIYIFEPVEPGQYSLQIQAKGFAELTLNLIELKVRDRKSLKSELVLESTRSSVTVEGETLGISSDVSVGVAVEENYLRHLPVNGRTVNALTQMAPGIVSGVGPGGELNSNGLRSNTNYYILDGVSYSGGAGLLGGPGGGGGPMMGPALAMGAGGATGLNSPSLDSLEEVRIQTSTFAPEFGRTPGAQISMTSRGGTNALHGSAYDYFRNDKFNANDWFANAAGLDRGAMHQNQFGGTLGGALVKNKTFLFGSADLALRDVPQTVVANVPSLLARNAAPAVLRPYLRAFPLANGPDLDNGAARFTAVTTNPQNRKSYAGRLDHTISPGNVVFARYSFTPSNSDQRGSEFQSPSVMTSQDSKSHSVTGAWIKSVSARTVNDLRINYTSNTLSSSGVMDTFGGAIPLRSAVVFPSGVDTTNGSFNLSVLGLSSYTFGARGGNDQKQLNVVDGLSITAGSHSYKVGFDYRRSSVTNHNVPYNVNATFNGLGPDEGSLLSGTATNVSVSSNVAAVYPQTVNYSAYIQDTWHVSAATTITYGVRWDVNPAPSVSQGERPFAISSFLSNRVTQGEPLYNTRWADFSPRVGFARQIRSTPGKEWMLRGGFGVFHDIGYGTSLGAFSGAPYSNVRTLTLAAFPLFASDLVVPGLPATKPFGRLGAADRSLQSPSIWQWNLTVERSYGPGQVLSVGYAGTRGQKLMRTESQPSFSGDYDLLTLATNGAESSYHALQVQYRRRYVKNLQTQVSYTWSHSIDTASNDLGMGGFATLYDSERGNSDYDVRHNLNVSGSYLLPSPKDSFLSTAFRNWYTDFMFAARAGTSFDIVGVSSTSSAGIGGGGQGLFAQVRPDYNGKIVWLVDDTVPGGQRLNKGAFDSASGYAQGNLGRNALRGLGLTQLDLSIRRRVDIGEHGALHLSVAAMNLLNHPSFANPSRNEGANMTSVNFGISTRTQAGGGFGSLYQSGGPRSLEFVLRYQF